MDMQTPVAFTVGIVNTPHHRRKPVHAVDAPADAERLHLHYTLCDIRLTGLGNDRASNYVQHARPEPVTCKRCLDELTRRAMYRRRHVEAELERRARCTAASLLAAYCSSLDLDALCEGVAPEHRPALRDAMLRTIADLRLSAGNRRMDPQFIASLGLPPLPTAS